VPDWLASLEQEVLDQTDGWQHPGRAETSTPPPPQVKLTLDEVHAQLTGWERHPA
jgi:hypothetical protein